MSTTGRTFLRKRTLVVGFVVVLLLALYYWLTRSHMTFGDYIFSKEHVQDLNQQSKLEAIKQFEREKVKNLEYKTTTMKTTTKIAEEKTTIDARHNSRPEYVVQPPPTLNQSTKNIVWVYSDGALTLKNRINNYIHAIERIRDEVIAARTESNWTDVKGEVEVLWCNQDDFLKTLATKYSHVKTVALSWHPWRIHSRMKWTSLGDVSNLLIQKYYEWSGSQRLCQMIQSPGYTKARWDAVYRQQCTTDMESTKKSKSIDFVYFWGKPINKNHYWPNDGYRYPSYFYNTAPMYIFYVHVVENVVITALGDIISEGLKLVPYSCSQDLDKRPPPHYKATMLYEEVFIMGQYWGEHFYHKMLENFPRIVPYLEFLRKYPAIKIHAAEVGGYTSFMMTQFGIDPSRLVKGVIRANVVIMPQSTPCAFPHVQSTQMFADKMHHEISKRFPNLPRNSVVLIVRSGSRRFNKAREIRRRLKKLTHEFNQTWQVFLDNPMPSPTEAMRMFHQAVLVVAPHGAGLANLVYCRPGTFVIEGVCNPPHVNMCYQRTAHILGHHYHGVVSSSGCEDVVNVEPDDILNAAEKYLSMAVKKR